MQTLVMGLGKNFLLLGSGKPPLGLENLPLKIPNFQFFPHQITKNLVGSHQEILG